jgi:hypothetical protein
MKEPDAALAYLDSWHTAVLEAGNKTSIYDFLLRADGPAAGVGAHPANDILYLVGFYVDTPANEICENDEMYHLLRKFLPDFMAQWTSDDFKKCCGGTANSFNPLDFNYTSNTNFITSYVHVFQREEVRVPRDLYNYYQSRGLLDREHTIGACCAYLHLICI